MKEQKKLDLFILTLTMGSGGAEKVISLLLPFLVLKFKVTLVLFNKNIHFNIPKDANVICLNNKEKLSFFEKLFSFPISIWQYYGILKREKADVSLSFLTRPNLINGVCKIFFPKAKVIISERCYPSKAYSSSKLRYLFYKFLIPIIYNKADVLFSNSIHINDDLIKNFNLSIPNYVVYNPVDIPEKINTTAFTTTNSDVLRIVNVGSIYSIKNQKLILGALANCSIKYKMTFVGDGVMKQELVDLSIHLKIDENVEFTGKVTNVNHYLTQSDCFILSSKSEGFPNVILEAMAVGLPIISTNCLSGPLEILNDNINVTIETGSFVIAKYGILINVDDVLGLTSAVNFISSHPDVREDFSKLSVERAKSYKTEVIFENLLEIIN